MVAALFAVALAVGSVSFVAGSTFSRHRIALMRHFWRMSALQRRLMLAPVFVMAGAALSVLISGGSGPIKPALPALGTADEALADEAYWDALLYGLSQQGARAYREHVTIVLAHARLVDMYNHRLAERGDVEMPKGGVSPLSLSEYLGRHPQYRRTPEEEAAWGTHFRKAFSEHRPSAVALEAFGGSG